MKFPQDSGSFAARESKAVCFNSNPQNRPSRGLTSVVGAVVMVGACALQAQPISVPNFSFESQAAPTNSPFVNIFVDAWEKAPEPAYYDAAIGTPFGIPWVGTAGVFLDVNPYGNRDGDQAGYLLAFPEVTLFQDDFGASFEVGNSYNLTIGLFGKSTLAPGSTFELSLYYRDGLDAIVSVGSTTAIYSLANFPDTPPLNLVDYAVNLPTVQAGDAWAGEQIGIQLKSTSPIELATGGNWDFDNVRLTAVPEPAAISLVTLGLGSLFLKRRRTMG